MHADVRPRRILIAAAAALVCVACLVVPFAGVMVSGAAELVAPTAIFISALALLATGAVLLALFNRTPNRSTVFLAAAYFAMGIIAFGQALTHPVGPGAPSPITAAFSVAPWLYVIWHTGLALCAALYFAMRWRPEQPLTPAAAPRFALTAVGLALVAGVGAIALTVAFGDRMPSFAGSGPVSAFVASGFGPAAFALCFLGTIVAFSWRDPDEVDAALALALVALTIDVGLHLATNHRYVVAWYAARLLSMFAASVVLVAAIRGLLGWRDRALRLERLLDEEKRIADHHAHRLEMLWRIGSNTGSEDAFLAELLEAAASVIVEGETMYGLLAHLDGAEMVVDLARESGFENVAKTGGRYPIDESILGIAMREGKTISWTDIHDDRRFDVRRLRALPWRAAIGTPFRVGETIYYVGFAGTAARQTPFSQLDSAFLETLASFCASRLHQRAHADRLRYQAEHDALTGILTRATFRARGFAALRAEPQAALAILDIDQFREVNETVGPVEADAALTEIAAALDAAAENGDVVGRLGGDIFGILMRGTTDRIDTEARVEKYHALFEQLFGRGEARFGRPLTATIGIALAPHDATSFEQLLARAETAVYAGKAAGGARWTFFERRFEDAYAHARRMQNELAEALVRGEFVLYFQPHVEFATGKVVGAEALLRWNHPVRGLIFPTEFIAFAEEHGMMGAIGAWVMNETVRRSAAWRAHDPDFRAWFNMSASELADPELLDRLDAGLGATRGVGVEITETVAMDDVHETLRNIDRLRAIGFAIGLDDFGTGYSSLAHLKRLPVDVVKIDQAFTSGVPGDPHDEAIVGAVLEIANRFGFEAIAEGVETAKQIAWLSAAGCRFGQGYLFASPMPAEAFDLWLAERRNSKDDRAYMRA
ncbi:MAG TPA: EAL domain-containing protein [Candidatus Elarobacter sp.]